MARVLQVRVKTWPWHLRPLLPAEWSDAPSQGPAVTNCLRRAGGGAPAGSSLDAAFWWNQQRRERRVSPAARCQDGARPRGWRPGSSGPPASLRCLVLLLSLERHKPVRICARLCAQPGSQAPPHPTVSPRPSLHPPKFFLPPAIPEAPPRAPWGSGSALPLPALPQTLPPPPFSPTSPHLSLCFSGLEPSLPTTH